MSALVKDANKDVVDQIYSCCGLNQEAKTVQLGNLGSYTINYRSPHPIVKGYSLGAVVAGTITLCAMALAVSRETNPVIKERLYTLMTHSCFLIFSGIVVRLAESIFLSRKSRETTT